MGDGAHSCGQKCMLKRIDRAGHDKGVGLLLGFLMAWLQAEVADPEWCNRDAHMSHKRIQLSTRRAARQEVVRLATGSEAAAAFLGHERPLNDGELPEPQKMS